MLVAFCGRQRVGGGFTRPAGGLTHAHVPVSLGGSRAAHRGSAGSQAVSGGTQCPKAGLAPRGSSQASTAGRAGAALRPRPPVPPSAAPGGPLSLPCPCWQVTSTPPCLRASWVTRVSSEAQQSHVWRHPRERWWRGWLGNPTGTWQNEMQGQSLYFTFVFLRHRLSLKKTRQDHSEIVLLEREVPPQGGRTRPGNALQAGGPHAGGGTAVPAAAPGLYIRSQDAAESPPTAQLLPARSSGSPGRSCHPPEHQPGVGGLPQVDGG